MTPAFIIGCCQILALSVLGTALIYIRLHNELNNSR